VADTYNNRIVKFDSSGNLDTTWGASGSVTGVGPSDLFDNPRGVAVDSSYNCYVADTQNNRIVKFDSSGIFDITWGEPPDFNLPQGIAVDLLGNVFVAQRDLCRIQKFSSNAPPTDIVIAQTEPVQVGAEIVVSATFTDPDDDAHTATWAWGDSSTSDGIVNQTNNTVTGTHIYNNPGVVYVLTLTVTDGSGASGEGTYEYVVVYDPDGGFVTGGGWIDSPEVALPDLTTGKANFGFISRYKNGATVPTGQTEFNFKAGDLNFHSESYEWLVVDSPKAQYKGSGTINGDGNYDFKVTVIDDAAVDKFRIKIWDAAGVVYDTQMGDEDYADPTTTMGGGSIVIH
jgi:hypothetical protein